MPAFSDPETVEATRKALGPNGLPMVSEGGYLPQRRTDSFHRGITEHYMVGDKPSTYKSKRIRPESQ